jgi:hypothetical protein
MTLASYITNRLMEYREKKEQLNQRIDEIVDGDCDLVTKVHVCQTPITLRNLVTGRVSAYEDIQRQLELEQPVTKTNTLEGLAAEALQVQDACNLSGLAIRFTKVVAELRECLRSTETGELYTDDVNQHPVVTMWLAKMADLNGLEWSGEKFTESHNWCTTQVKE